MRNTKQTKAPAAPAITVVTPECIVQHDHSQKADTEGQYADNKFKLTVLFDKDTDMSEVDERADEAAIAAFGAAGPRCYRDGDTTGKAEQSGAWVMTAKSAFAPRILDEDGGAYEGHVGRDARVRMFIQMVPHRAGGSPGVAARLLAVQVIEPGQQALGASNPFAKKATPAPAPAAAPVATTAEQRARQAQVLAEVKQRVQAGQ